MSHSVMSKKSGVIFDFLDIERDGILTWDEMKSFPARLKNIAGKEHLGEELEQVYREVWKRIHATVGNSEDVDQISREQFIEGTDVVRETAWFRETFVDKTTSIYFDFIDENGNGLISIKEWRKLYAARGITDPDFTKKAFDKIDTNNDGTISRDEFKKAVTLFSLPDDTSGNYTFIYDFKQAP